MTTTPDKPRRWFRFSLRTFLVLLTLFCVWLGVQVKWVRDRREALKWVHRSATPADFYTPAPWSIRLVERGVPSITVDPAVAQDTEKVRKLKALFPEAILDTPADGRPVNRDPNPGYPLKQL